MGLRKFNKYLLNPIMLRFAGRRRFYAAVLHHAGRRSGRSYTTPVVADPIEGGFLVPLPYGSDTDWCRNVLAAGRATLDRQGETFEVIRPVLLETESALEKLSPSGRARWRWDECGRHSS
jgi:deazaflavin-dependent oxidoreductase (nitroreductase family)